MDDGVFLLVMGPGTKGWLGKLFQQFKFTPSTLANFSHEQHSIYVIKTTPFQVAWPNPQPLIELPKVSDGNPQVLLWVPCSARQWLLHLPMSPQHFFPRSSGPDCTAPDGLRRQTCGLEVHLAGPCPQERGPEQPRQVANRPPSPVSCVMFHRLGNAAGHYQRDQDRFFLPCQKSPISSAGNSSFWCF